MKMTRFYTALAMLVAGAAFAGASEMGYSYAGSDELFQWGAKLSQTYDIAIKLPGNAFAGCKLTSVSVPVVSTEKISGYSVWLSSDLILDTVDGKKVNVPDIASVDVQPQQVEECLGYIVCTFDTPYEITADGVYVGYSFTVNSTAGDYERYPVLVAEGAKEDGFFVHSSKTYRQWQDRSTEVGCVSHLRVNLEGDFKEHAVSIDPLGDFPVQSGNESVRDLCIHNLGSSPIASIGYEVTIDGAVTEGSFTFDEPVPAVYNRQAQARVTIPAVADGTHAYSLSLTRVNGVPNGIEAVCAGTITALEVLPTKRPLMEEYTGAWCGWCPRGWVGMEMMSELYPDDFVCISYHDSDVLQLASGYPKMTGGFPSACMDRSVTMDPYGGTSDKTLGVRQDWLAMSQQTTPAAISLEAEHDGNGRIKVTSDVFWAMQPADGEYRVEYVLLGDGIYSDAIKQSNYYSTYAPSYNDMLDQFCAGGQYGQSTVVIPYNDVALLTSGLYGVEGSVTDTAVGSHNVYTYTFDLADCAVSFLAKDFHIVAMLLKTNNGYGTVVNANKCRIANMGGINDVIRDRDDAVEVRYYDLTGRELQTPSGLCIKRAVHADGTVTTAKVLR